MKHTEQEIVEKAKQVMKDLRENYYTETCVDDATFDKQKKLFFGKDKGETHPIWTVSINSLFDKLDFLHISDETGEPLYYMNFSAVFGIGKNPEGKYYRIKE
ncbi:MAG TPA: hypothetical protein VFR70_02620 [Flavobacterium sp.]|nr:hypothetical protein [Flavobacterium sp.]